MQSFNITIYMEEVPTDIEVIADDIDSWSINDVTVQGNQLAWERMAFKSPDGKWVEFSDFYAAAIQKSVSAQWRGKRIDWATEHGTLHRAAQGV